MVIQKTIHANRSAEHNINVVFKGSEKGKESEERCRRLTTDQVIESTSLAQALPSSRTMDSSRNGIAGGKERQSRDH